MKPPAPKNGHVLNVRLPDAVLDAARRLAAADGVSLSVWARRVLTAATNIPLNSGAVGADEKA